MHVLGAGNDQPIPDYPALKMNGKAVDVTYFGARSGKGAPRRLQLLPLLPASGPA